MMGSASENRLSVEVGQYSTAGQKPSNQDFHGALIPEDKELTLKGITLALADGISSSPVSHEASETIVKALMTDYYCTPSAWTVKTSASRVISATNSWLYAQNRRARIDDMNRGKVSTLSALILKGHHAHIFHIGDSRIWRLNKNSFEQLTQDHQIKISASESYLSRAVGTDNQVEIDYKEETLNPGDIYLLTTDGVHEYWDKKKVHSTLKKSRSFDKAAETIANDCLNNGSTDNLTIQIVRINDLPERTEGDNIIDDALNLPLKDLPAVGDDIDGFKILRPLSNTARSHIYLATGEGGEKVVLKFPSMDLRESKDYLRRFVMEEWISRRINSAYVLGAAKAPETRTSLYAITEYVEGQTLRQWMTDHPDRSLEQVRDIVEQISKGLRAFHRREMLHQDLRPENVMIDNNGTVKIIDFGSTIVAGVQEISPQHIEDNILGTVQYTAPEYFLGYVGSPISDLYSLGAIAYELLTGKLPYGGKVSHIRTEKDLKQLTLASTANSPTPLPEWVEYALQKALHVDSHKRYQAMSEFVADLKKPSPGFKPSTRSSLIEKDPVRFWQSLTILFALTSFIFAILYFST